MAKPSPSAANPNSDDATASMRRNRLLALLDEHSLAALAVELEHRDLSTGEPIYSDGKPIRHVYFPTDGVISVLATAGPSGSAVEVATIGREGTSGLPSFFGATHGNNDAMVQVSGAAWRMPAAAFAEAARRDAQLAGVLHRYAHAFFVQITQGLACNSAHSARQRCARWLLMTQDRVDSDTFDLKQEFLGQMLGERRAAVSKVASQLRARGLITYSRGAITILDRPRLEEEACACYHGIRQQYRAMLR